MAAVCALHLAPTIQNRPRAEIVNRLLGVLLWAGFFFGLIAFQVLYGDEQPKTWLLQTVQQYPAATIGIGISAITAFFVVAVLELTAGSVQFEVIGFKFQGAAGQVVLWMLCFLSIVFAMVILWNKT